MAYNPFPAIQAADSASIDAFSRWRVSEPVGLFASQAQYDAEGFLYESGATGDGVAPSHSANTRMVALTVNAGTGTSFVQSFEYVPYQPGRSQLVFITGNLTAGVAGAVVDVGLFDANNGIIFRQNGTSGLQLIRRTNTSGTPSDTATVNQASWNLDPLNGNGPSGLTLNAANVFILVIDAQFLGMGRIRVGFDIGGAVVYVHEFLNANVLTVPYAQTLTLPIQMLVTATATAGAKTAYFKCASVSSEGGFSEDLGYTFACPEGTVSAGSGADTSILSLRPLTTFNGLTNRTRFRLNSVEILVTGTNPINWKLCINSTFSAAPTWPGTAATTGSAFEATTAPGTLSGLGTVIASGYASAGTTSKTVTSAQLSNRYPISLNRAGAVRALGTLTLVVNGIGGASATRAVMNWTEVR